MGKGLALVFHKEENGPLFEKIIIALKARYHLLSAEELEESLTGKSKLKNSCHISFDDGEKSFYHTVFPLLKKHSVPVSLFVSPKIISTGTNYWFQEMEGYNEQVVKTILAEQSGIAAPAFKKYTSQEILAALPVKKINELIKEYREQTKAEKKTLQNMSLDQLKEVAASGLVSIGAHTLNHPVLKNEDDETVAEEITGSVKMLEEIIGKPVKYFAYPNGRPGIDFGEREISCLQNNNISMAFSSELDHLSANVNMYSIPRMGFARMGLNPSNPLVVFRLNTGKGWFNIRSVGKPSETAVREKILALLNEGTIS